MEINVELRPSMRTPFPWVLVSLLFVNCISFSIKVKIVGKTSELRPDVREDIDYNDLKGAKSEPSVFIGPSYLQRLIGKCFLFGGDKYIYRVCPFHNITQHERDRHFGAYNGIIGVWKEWLVQNNSFDSLMFYDGDNCGEGVERSAKMVWVCNQDIAPNDKVLNITEPKTCFYEILFASEFGCENRNIYRHLNQEFQQKWDQIESNYFYGELTPFGYKSALNELFIESTIVGNKTDLVLNDLNFESKEDCFHKFVALSEENKNLMKKIEILEKQLKNQN